ncbi:MAG TPA: 4-phosphopantetheinyl transferase [Ruminococcaceae bacterium]|nr:4-phosphopantetheinyl transferase [Oscillospiraceae bacterium]
MERANRFRSRDDRLRCIGAGALIDYVLNIREDELKYNECGKPFLPGQGSSFNLSHSGDYIALAIGDGTVGVDVEQIDPRHFDLAKRIFTQDESEWLNRNESNKSERFFQLWTLKESAIKAVGLGLSIPLQSFSVIPLIEQQPITVRGMTLFGQTVLLTGHSLSLCSTEPPIEELSPIFVTANDIQNNL